MRCGRSTMPPRRAAWLRIRPWPRRGLGVGGDVARHSLPCRGSREAQCAPSWPRSNTIAPGPASLRADHRRARGALCAGAGRDRRDTGASLHRPARHRRPGHRGTGTAHRASGARRAGGAARWRRVGRGHHSRCARLPRDADSTWPNPKVPPMAPARSPRARSTTTSSRTDLRWPARHAGRDQFRDPARGRCAGTDRR